MFSNGNWLMRFSGNGNSWIICYVFQLNQTCGRDSQVRDNSHIFHLFISFLVRLLNEAQGSLLDDEQLVNTLQSSKKTSEEVSEQLLVSEQTEAKIDAAREVC